MYEFIDKNGNISANSAKVVVIDKFGKVKEVGGGGGGSSIRSFGISLDGGGSAIVVGTQADITIPYNMTIQSWTMLANVTGSIVIDIWKDTYGNFPPTVADSITGSAKPTISTNIKGQSSTLTGWTILVTAGDTIRFNVDSCTDITRVNLIITGIET